MATSKRARTIAAIDALYSNCTLHELVQAVERARAMGAMEQVALLDDYIHRRWGAPPITGSISIGAK